MTIAYESGDVKVISMKLVNGVKNATVDLRPQCLSFSIYEDMQEPTMYAELVMVDAINLVKDFPIIGEETLEVCFITPGRDRMTTYNFNVFSVDGTSTMANGKGSIYTLKGVSAEHYTNSVNQIDKTYKTTIDEIVLDILVNELPTKKKLNIEATRGLTELTVPRHNPFVAIDLARQRAIAKRPSGGGTFVFYENQYGFHFVSVEKLLEDGKKSIDSRSFTYAPTTNTDKDRQSFSFRNIQKYTHLTKFNTVSKMSGGLFKSTSRYFDMATKEFKEDNFEIDKNLKAFETGEKKAALTNSATLVNKAKEGSPNYMFSPKDSNKGNDLVADYATYRRAFIEMFNENIVRVMVYGDNYLTVGDVITLNLPDTSGTTGKKVNDERFSGNYIITKLRHMFTQEDKRFKHNITIDCNKIGYGS
jgi:hypothetical protein